MGVLDTNRSQIQSGGLISASFVSDIYDVFTGNTLQNVTVSGSLTVTNGVVANLTGTSSHAIISNTALTASHITGDISVTSGSFVNLNVSDTFIVDGTILFYTASLPNVDPQQPNQLWRSGSHLMISLG